MEETLEVVLFSSGQEGLRLVGRLTDADLVESVRSRLAIQRRRELGRLECPVRLAETDPESDPDVA